MKESDVPKPLPPPLLEQLRRELTNSLLARVRAFAASRVGLLRSAKIPTYDDPKQEAEVMAQDAVTSTILGHRRWDPALPLYDHLCGVVRSESSNRIAHAKKHHQLSLQNRRLDDSQDENVAFHGRVARKGPTSVARPSRIVSLGDAARRMAAQLRQAALMKPATVTLLIDAYEDGCENRKEVLAATGMTEDQYRNARRILDRMIATLPEDFQESAHDALEISYDCYERPRQR
ncbi:MAG: hypothetical protein KC464_04890 [Myxococcales bacterium]|nr:hypothetical protein [Myxococcales bacterium]